MGGLNSRNKILCIFTVNWALTIITRTFDPFILSVIAAELIGGCLMLCLLILTVPDDDNKAVKSSRYALKQQE